MKNKVLIALGLATIAAILLIGADLPISQFPNTPTPLDSDLFVLAQTQAPKTNKNIRYDQLRGAIRSGLATETYVNNVSNAIVSGASDHLWTNNGTFLQPTTNGDVRIIGNLSLTSTGHLGGLIVTQDVRLLGHNSTSNFVWTCTNSATGEGEWRTAGGSGFAALEIQTNGVRLGLVTNVNWTYGMTGSVSSSTAILGVDDSIANAAISNALLNIINTVSNFLATSSIDVKTNQTMLILQDTPISGSQWYVGTNGTPVTNDTRSGFEVNVKRRSMRMGELADGIHPSNLGGQATNYWNDTNLLGPVTIGFGSNVTVRAAYSSIGGGSMNLILTNSKYSVISGGYNNIIDTNSPTSVIAGGGFNQIYGQPTVQLNRTIGGGSNNIISGPITDGSTISGGRDNLVQTDGNGFATIGGGFDNIIKVDGDYGFIGGGRDNRVGVTGSSAGVSSDAAVVAGRGNTAKGVGGFVGGGNANNLLANDDDYSSIVGGRSNSIGIVAGNFESKLAFIGGGAVNQIANDATHSSIVGGNFNSIAGPSTNSVIGGGYNNIIQANANNASILGGKDNSVSGNFGTSIGSSNSVTALRATAIGNNVTNSTTDGQMISELISYNTAAVISGAGNGNTNYLLSVTSPKMLLGSSNVNIYGVANTINGKTHSWSVNITNLSADTWGIRFDSGTNRWKFQSWMYGTNAPSVLTNNTLLRLQGESQGTNTLVTYQYFSPAL